MMCARSRVCPCSRRLGVYLAEALSSLSLPAAGRLVPFLIGPYFGALLAEKAFVYQSKNTYA